MANSQVAKISKTSYVNPTIINRMNEDSIIEIFGNNFYKQIHEKNYEICFFGNSTWQVNFSFSNYTKQLSTVNFWYGVD